MATLSAGYHQLLESGTALAQTTTTPPQGPPSVRSGSRGIGPAPRTSEPVTRGTSSTPDLHIPTTPKRASVRPALAGPAAGLEGAGAGAGGGTGGGGSGSGGKRHPRSHLRSNPPKSAPDEASISCPAMRS